MCIEYAVGNSSAGITTDSKALKSIRVEYKIVLYLAGIFQISVLQLAQRLLFLVVHTMVLLSERIYSNINK